MESKQRQFILLMGLKALLIYVTNMAAISLLSASRVVNDIVNEWALRMDGQIFNPTLGRIRIYILVGGKSQSVSLKYIRAI